MRGAFKIEFMWVFAVLVVVAHTPSPAQVIDFETLPGGGSTVDQQEISTEYASLGVTFTLLDRSTGMPIGFPRIAKAGAPQTAFEGCVAPDTPRPYHDLGVSFLTDGTSLGVDGDLLIEYSTPVAQASGVIIDIDCRINGGAPCEQWTITAYDTAGSALDSVVIDAPQAGESPECVNPDAGVGDSEAFAWAFDIGDTVIKSIILRYTGVAANVGLAFDNFSVSTVAGPPSVLATSNADTICAGEKIELTTIVTGGLPPFTFQWQQGIGSTWFDLGTASSQEVRPGSTADYRVTVTDAAAQQATSPALTVVVETDHPLCSASLIVSCHDGDNVVRYSFLSHLPEVLVPSGSGGLNGPSELICGDGKLYVSSQLNDRVLRYQVATGTFVDLFVAAGSGGLNIPVGLDFGPDDGNLYVVSSYTHSVLRYDTSGAFIDVFIPTGSGLNTPTDLVFGPDDDLYVGSLGSNKVLRFDGTTGVPLGDFVTSGSGGLDGPRGLEFGPDGDLYVAEQYNSSVRRYDDSTGAFVEVFVPSGSGGLDRANDLVFGPDGVLYVASYNNSKVLGYDATTGAFLGELPDGILNGPAWLEVSCQPIATGIREHRAPTLGLSVEPNVPNPFNPWTTIGFSLPRAGPTRVTVVDVTGRVVATLLDRNLPAGSHVVEWDGDAAGRPAPSGVYFVRVQSGSLSAARKMVLVR